MKKNGGPSNGPGGSFVGIGSSNPLDIMAEEHRLQERLCDALERLADSLPDRVDRLLVATLLPALKIDLSVHVEDEEYGLFPLLRERSEPGDNVSEILGQLNQEHLTDQGYAEEIVAQLELLQQGQDLRNANTFGYMLRGFFEGQRRHRGWEDAVVLPLARQRLDADDLTTLATVMVSNRRRKPVPVGNAVLFDGVRRR